MRISEIESFILQYDILEELGYSQQFYSFDKGENG